MELIHIEGNEKTKPFYLGKYLVTQQEWLAIAGTSDWDFKGPRFPITDVSVAEILNFCNLLSQYEGLTPCYYADDKFTKVYGKKGKDQSYPNEVYWNQSANGYRLPARDEWEYALEGGKERTFKYREMNFDDIAWYAENNDSEIKPVGQKLPNELGLYDMIGNAWEYAIYRWKKDNSWLLDVSLMGSAYEVVDKSRSLYNNPFELETPLSLDYGYGVSFRIAKNAE
jgi:formylglycine-generating enzyme required for sulfatase activity